MTWHDKVKQYLKMASQLAGSVPARPSLGGCEGAPGLANNILDGRGRTGAKTMTWLGGLMLRDKYLLGIQMITEKSGPSIVCW